VLAGVVQGGLAATCPPPNAAECPSCRGPVEGRVKLFGAVSALGGLQGLLERKDTHCP